MSSERGVSPLYGKSSRWIMPGFFSLRTVSQLKSTMLLSPSAPWCSFHRYPMSTGFVLGSGTNWNSGNNRRVGIQDICILR